MRISRMWEILLERLGRALFYILCQGVDAIQSLWPLQRNARQLFVGLYHVVSAEHLEHIEHLLAYKTPAMFERDLEHFRRDYKPISYAEFVAGQRAGVDWPVKAALLSFDDGYAECFTIARPLLLKHKIPCIFFIATDFIDNRRLFYRNKASLCIAALQKLEPEGWQRLAEALHRAAGQACRTPEELAALLRSTTGPDEARLDRVCQALGIDCRKFLEDRRPFMTSEQVRQLAVDGFTIGGHGLSHYSLEDVDSADVEKEVVESCQRVREWTGQASVPFALPFGLGRLNPQLFAAIRQRHPYIDVFFTTLPTPALADLIQERIILDLPVGAEKHSNVPWLAQYMRKEARRKQLHISIRQYVRARLSGKRCAAAGGHVGVATDGSCSPAPDAKAPEPSDTPDCVPHRSRAERLSSVCSNAGAGEGGRSGRFPMGTLAIVTPAFAQISETFIYRQVMGLRELTPWVLTSRRCCVETFPATGVPVEMLDSTPPPLTSRFSERVSARLRRDWWSWYRRDVRFAESCFTARKTGVVLAQYGSTALAIVEATRRLGLPLVVHFHGHDASRALRNREYVRQMRAAFPHIAAIVVVAEKMRRNLLAIGVPPERIHKIPYGVDLTEFVCPRRGETEVVTFLNVGRLWPKKGILQTLHAFAATARQVPAARLRIVGEGGLRGAAESLVQRLGIGDKVTFLGARPYSIVLEEMTRADVFVQHSLTDADGDEEGLPVAILEAAASGLPVVSTRHAGIVEEVLEGQSGLLVDEGDVAGFGAAMTTLAQSAALRREMGQCGRAYVEQNFQLAGELNALAELLCAVGQRRNRV